jgi:ornithine carbamoyltransferase
MKRDLLTLNDLTGEEMDEIFDLTALHKKRLKEGNPIRSLPGKTLALIFKKPSTRTRISFEVGMFQLGGHALLLNLADMHWDKSESIPDSARVFSRYLDVVAIRTFDQGEVEALARHSEIPVINALTDTHHPCQILADIFTLREKFGDVSGIKVAYVGDGNNIVHSWMQGAARTGIHLVVCTPERYGPEKEILEKTRDWIENNGGGKKAGSIELSHDPMEAVRDADVIYTDVWASMGQEDTLEQRRKDFLPFQVNAGLLRASGKKPMVMHCLPAHRGEEITDEVLDSEQAIIFDEAENRLHTQKALLEFLLKNSSR